MRQIIKNVIDDDTGELQYTEEIDMDSGLWKDGRGAIIKGNIDRYVTYHKTRLSDVLTSKGDWFRANVLSEHIKPDNNVICVDGSKGQLIPADIDGIASILNYNKKNTLSLVNRLIKLGVIAKMTIESENRKYVTYVFNPIYANACRFIDSDLYFLFKEYLDEKFPGWIVERYETKEPLSKEDGRSKIWDNKKGAILNPREYRNIRYSDFRLSDNIKTKKYLENIYIAAENIYKDTNVIYMNNRPAGIEELCALFDSPEERVKRFLSDMDKMEIIKKIRIVVDGEKVNGYALNPIYINSSKYIGLDLYRTFKDSIDAYLPKDIIKRYTKWIESEKQLEE